MLARGETVALRMARLMGPLSLLLTLTGCSGSPEVHDYLTATGATVGGSVVLHGVPVGGTVWVTLPQLMTKHGTAAVKSETLTPQPDVDILGYRSLDARVTGGVIMAFTDGVGTTDNPVHFPEALQQPDVDSTLGPYYRMVHVRTRDAEVQL